MTRHHLLAVAERIATMRASREYRAGALDDVVRALRIELDLPFTTTGRTLHLYDTIRAVLTLRASLSR